MLTLAHAQDKQQTKGEMSPLEKQLHGTLILFQVLRNLCFARTVLLTHANLVPLYKCIKDIQYVRDMPAKPVQKSNRFGPHSAFFSIVTETERYATETETRK
jgi:hypothetical protein